MSPVAIEAIKAAHNVRLLEGMTGVPVVAALAPSATNQVCCDIARNLSSQRIQDLAKKSWKIGIAFCVACLAAKGVAHVTRARNKDEENNRRKQLAASTVNPSNI
jgi:hypothetical protein